MKAKRILRFSAIAALLAASVAYWRVEARNEELVQEVFSALSARTSDAIAYRIILFQYGLRGARGAVVAVGADRITRQQFINYSRTRDLSTEFRGAKGFGFIRYVPPASLEAFLAEAQADGWPDFTRKVLDDVPPEHFIIQYIEPVEQNVAAVGLDVATERRRREAARLAVALNTTTITEPITLVQESGKTLRAFLVLLPVYRAGASVATEPERWAALEGWSYAPVVIDDVLAGIPGEGRQFDVRVLDRDSALGDEPFFSTATWQDEPSLFRRVEVTVFNRRWTVEIIGTPLLLREVGLVSPWLAAMLAGFCVFLVSAVYAYRRSLLEAARRAERTVVESEAKSDFLANISHEIRTPMNAVLGMLQLLRTTPLQSAQRDFVTKAEAAAKLLLAVLNDVLDFSKAESGRMVLDPVPFSPEAVFQAVGAVVLGAEDRTGVEVIFDLDPTIPRQVIGDDLRLKQVLTNLASNALKFTERGEVVLSARRVGGSDGQVTIEFRVRDTGIGIAKDQLQRVFQGFAQAEASTTRRFGGTGLGLAISQRLVALMGGELAVESELGVGSEFFFSLPMPVAEAEPLEDTPDALSGLTVLLVDDNASTLRIISEQCRYLGATVRLAEDGPTARRIVAAEPIDVALVDWQLPGEDGMDLAVALKSMAGAPRAPAVVLMTAATRQGRALEAASRYSALAGMLFKPTSPSELRLGILRALSPELDAGAAAEPVAGGPLPLDGIRVLVVEDNRVNQQVAQELLQGRGASVQLANDGIEALERLRLDPGWPQVVLMDIQMPRCDGFECTRRLRGELGLDVPVIAMTANSSPAEALREREAGMVGHVSKPFAIDDLVAAILETVHGSAPAPAPAEHGLAAGDAAFDAAAALRRFGGKAASYVRALRSFADEAPRLVEEAAAVADRLARARQLHTLKGLAATVGAGALARTAAAIEGAIRAGQVDAVDDGIATLREEVARAVSWARAEASRLAPTAAATPHMDDTAVLSALRTIRPLLESNRLEAVTRAEALCAALGASRPPALGDVMKALERFDFRVALGHVDRWIQQLEKV